MPHCTPLHCIAVTCSITVSTHQEGGLCRLEPSCCWIAASRYLADPLMSNSWGLTGLWVLVTRCAGPQALPSSGASEHSLLLLLLSLLLFLLLLLLLLMLLLFCQFWFSVVL